MAVTVVVDLAFSRRREVLAVHGSCSCSGSNANDIAITHGCEPRAVKGPQFQVEANKRILHDWLQVASRCFPTSFSLVTCAGHQCSKATCGIHQCRHTCTTQARASLRIHNHKFSMPSVKFNWDLVAAHITTYAWLPCPSLEAIQVSVIKGQIHVIKVHNMCRRYVYSPHCARTTVSPGQDLVRTWKATGRNPGWICVCLHSPVEQSQIVVAHNLQDNLPELVGYDNIEQLQRTKLPDSQAQSFDDTPSHIIGGHFAVS